MDNSGVYVIICMPTRKIYIGSSNNITYRWYQHKKELTAHRHVNNHLQAAYNKYGKDDFKFLVLEYVSELGILHVREQFYIDKYRSYDRKRGFNLSSVTTGGSCKGSDNGFASLTESLVDQIYRRLAIGEAPIDLAREFKVNKSTIALIGRGQTWKHVTGGTDLHVENRRNSSKLTIKDVINIKSSKKATGILASLYHVSPSTICDIIYNRTWRHVKGRAVQ